MFKTLQTPISESNWDLGRHLFGVAALTLGLIALFWHDYNRWMLDVWNGQGGRVFVYAVAAAQIFGGAAIQFRTTAKTGAIALSAVYLFFAMLYVPRIVTGPQVYDHWGNFFEQFSLATGAAIVYARSSPAWDSTTVRRAARVLFGLCVASFTLEQAFYLDNTASLVPKWLPAGPMFWSVATTIFFALAAIALFTNRKALLATRLLTLMLVTFGLIVWLPLILANPHSHVNWSEGAETFAIAGAAWILADLLDLDVSPLTEA